MYSICIDYTYFLNCASNFNENSLFVLKAIICVLFHSIQSIQIDVVANTIIVRLSNLTMITQLIRIGHCQS